MSIQELKKYLSRYNEWTCPDNYYEAWKILFADYNPSNKAQILKWARKMLGFTNRKYNWY